MQVYLKMSIGREIKNRISSANKNATALSATA